MNDSQTNPYAPPTTPSDDGFDGAAGFDSLQISGPIHFDGKLRSVDVLSFLRAHDHIGCGSMFMTGTGVGLILLVFLLFVGGAIGLIALGIVGWLALTLLTSLIPYRRSVFYSSNPNWDEGVTGELSTSGVTVRRQQSETHFRWDWFGEAVVGKSVVAFLPALHPHQPILFTPSMLNGLDDWDRLVELARAWDSPSAGESTAESRRYNARKWVRGESRPRSVVVPEGAVAFEGVVTSRDLRHLPAALIRRNRPTRAYLLIVGLAFSGSLVMIGVARAGGYDTVLPAFLFALIALAVVLLFVVRRIRDVRSTDETIYYLKAFADDTGMTSDFGVTWSTIPWHAMRVAESTDEAISFARPGIRQFLIARRDMFAGESAWQSFHQLIQGNVEPSESLSPP